MTETERRQHTDDLKARIAARQQGEMIQRTIAGLERERQVLNAAGRVEALQRDITSILQRDDRLTQAIEAHRRPLAQLAV